MCMNLNKLCQITSFYTLRKHSTKELTQHISQRAAAKSLQSCPTPQTAAHQAPPSLGFSSIRQMSGEVSRGSAGENQADEPVQVYISSGYFRHYSLKKKNSQETNKNFSLTFRYHYLTIFVHGSKGGDTNYISTVD